MKTVAVVKMKTEAFTFPTMKAAKMFRDDVLRDRRVHAVGAGEVHAAEEEAVAGAMLRVVGEIMQRLATTRAGGGKPCSRCGRDRSKDPQVFGWVQCGVVCSSCAAVLPKEQLLRVVPAVTP